MSMLDEVVDRKRLYNPDASDEKIPMFMGDVTNLININQAEYPEGMEIYQTMRDNFWTTAIVDLTGEKRSLSELTEHELEAYKGTLGFLVFLDSEQTNNCPNLMPYVTAPEYVLCLAEQTAQEALHTYSYQEIFNSVFSKQETQDIYYYFKRDAVQAKRNKYIADIYQNFLDTPTWRNFIKVLIADLLLEGLYFYNGFAFFYNLALRGLAPGTAAMIRFINRDEFSHIWIFSNFIKDLLYNEHYPEEIREYTYEILLEMTDEAIQQEIEWSNHIYGNKILGISEDSIFQYTHSLAHDNILGPLGIDKYEAFESPYKHLERVANIDGDEDLRGNFFEGNDNSYTQISAIEGFDDL